MSSARFRDNSWSASGLAQLPPCPSMAVQGVRPSLAQPPSARSATAAINTFIPPLLESIKGLGQGGKARPGKDDQQRRKQEHHHHHRHFCRHLRDVFLQTGQTPVVEHLL